MVWTMTHPPSPCLGSTAPRGPRPLYHGFTIHRVKYTALGRNTLDEWSARRRELYLTTHNTHRRQASMPSAGFEPIIPARELSHTHAFDHIASGIGCIFLYFCHYPFMVRSPTHVSRTSSLNFLYIARMSAPSRGIVTITSPDYNNVTWSQLLAVATFFVASQFHPWHDRCRKANGISEGARQLGLLHRDVMKQGDRDGMNRRR